MRNFIFLLLIAILTLLVLFFISNPELLDKIWLWLIGFAGGIAGLFSNIKDGIKKWIKREDDQEKELVKVKAQAAVATPSNNDTLINAKLDTLLNNPNIINQPTEKPFDGTVLTVLRYIDDKETTLGLLYFRNDFFCYTLEDTHHDVKIKHQTRIPAGEYTLGYQMEDTGLTLKYREKHNWFHRHLHIKNVPDFSGVYIHIGNNHKHSSGCLLIADGVNAASVQKAIQHSTQAYKRLYLRLKDLLDNDEKIKLVIRDENWFKNINKT